MSERSYIAIDLKSFYASIECVERNLDPLNTNLVVADESRTEKTICLAVTPSLKAHGISGRARLFEVIQAVTTVNNQRRYNYRKQIRKYVLILALILLAVVGILPFDLFNTYLTMLSIFVTTVNTSVSIGGLHMSTFIEIGTGICEVCQDSVEYS